MSCGTKAGAAGMLKNTGSELKERLGEVRHRLIPGSAQPWAKSRAGRSPRLTGFLRPRGK